MHCAVLVARVARHGVVAADPDNGSCFDRRDEPGSGFVLVPERAGRIDAEKLDRQPFQGERLFEPSIRGEALDVGRKLLPAGLADVRRPIGLPELAIMASAADSGPAGVSGGHSQAAPEARLFRLQHQCVELIGCSAVFPEFAIGKIMGR
jgi:hypothetical protein